MNKEMLQKQKEKVRQFKNDEDAGRLTVATVKPDRRKKPRPSAVGFRERRWNQDKRGEVECENCGSWKHQKHSRECSARAARCNNCGRLGHYARKCRSGRHIRTSNNQFSRRKISEANSLREEDRYCNRERSEEVSSRRRSPEALKVE